MTSHLVRFVWALSFGPNLAPAAVLMEQAGQGQVSTDTLVRIGNSTITLFALPISAPVVTPSNHLQEFSADGVVLHTADNAERTHGAGISSNAEMPSSSDRASIIDLHVSAGSPPPATEQQETAGRVEASTSGFIRTALIATLPAALLAIVIFGCGTTIREMKRRRSRRYARMIRY